MEKLPKETIPDWVGEAKRGEAREIRNRIGANVKNALRLDVASATDLEDRLMKMHNPHLYETTWKSFVDIAANEALKDQRVFDGLFNLMSGLDSILREARESEREGDLKGFNTRMEEFKNKLEILASQK